MSESAGRLPAPADGFAWRSLRRDEQLAKRAAAGDEQAFAAIFSRYHQQLYRYCRAILTDSGDAEDATQATMVKALRSLPGERREIALRPWLYRVAHNESISILRSRRETVELDRTDIAAPATVELTAEVRDSVRTLVDDMATLPDRQRSSLVMRELNDLSYEEIGAALSLSSAAARQAVYEARMALTDAAEGREMECTAARESISAGDRRVLRGRKLRAHLRGCDRCRDFEAAIRDRRTTLAALAPPLAAPAALAILHGALGTGSAGLAGSAAGGTAGSVGAGFAGAAAIKTAAAVLAVAVVGGAASVDVFDSKDDDPRPAPAATPASTETGSPAGSAPVAETGGEPAEPAAGEPRSGHDRTAGAGRARDRGHGADKPAGNGGGRSSGAPGQTGAAPGQSVSADAPGTAPGQSGTTPGQSGIAPGHAHSNVGGGGAAAAPGQTGSSPGGSESAPGHSASATGAGSSSTPHGNAVDHTTTPGQAAAPGQADK